MCLKYKGVDYHYAFEFDVPIEQGKDRPFRVVISKFREDSRDFSGLCLENELRVISEESRPFEAFFDIINRTIDITLDSEKDFKHSFPGQSPQPLLKVEDKDFLDKFEACKKSRESSDYYEQLSIFFEKPMHATRETTVNDDIGLQSHYELMLFLYFSPLKSPRIKAPRVFVI